MASADASFVPEQELYTHAIELRRAMIDPEQSFQLCIGMDDFSRTFFFRVPHSWSTFEIVEAVIRC